MEAGPHLHLALALVSLGWRGKKETVLTPTADPGAGKVRVLEIKQKNSRTSNIFTTQKTVPTAIVRRPVS